jgi:hypothetical protein
VLVRLGQRKQSLLLGEDLGRREAAVDCALGDGSAIATPRGLRRHRPRQVDHSGEDDLVGEVVEPPVERLGRHGNVGRDGGSQLSDQLGDSPGRLLVGERLERGVGELRSHDVTDAVHAPHPTGRIGDQALGADPQVGDSPRPLRVEDERVRVLLVGTRVEHGVALEPPPLPGCRGSVVGVVEALDRVLDAGGDGLGPLGELPEDVLGHVDDLGDPVDRLAPPDAEASSQLGTQPGVVEPAEGLLVLLDGAGVERQPSPVG